jgi:beta-lactamase regulating signal transducer with metallopeptidase domain
MTSALTWFGEESIGMNLENILIDSAIRSTALLLCIFAAVVFLRRQSARLRHNFWMCGILVSLALPLLTLALPAWPIVPFGDGSQLSWNSGSIELAAENSNQSDTAIKANSPSTISDFERSKTSAETIVQTDSNSAIAGMSVGNAVVLLCLVAWMAGVLLVAFRVARGWLFLKRLERDSVAIRAGVGVEEGAIYRQLKTLCDELTIRGEVTLLMGSASTKNNESTSPMSWGVFRRYVYLPKNAERWSAQQIAAVLTHELAHLQRRDPLIQWLAQIACAVYWFNPMIWIASWQIQTERELACDDIVLANGTAPADYAELLVKLARKYAHHETGYAFGLTTGLAMAAPSKIERRVIAILDPALPRRGSLLASRLCIGILLTSAVPLSMLANELSDETKPEPLPKNARFDKFSRLEEIARLNQLGKMHPNNEADAKILKRIELYKRSYQAQLEIGAFDRNKRLWKIQNRPLSIKEFYKRFENFKADPPTQAKPKERPYSPDDLSVEAAFGMGLIKIKGDVKKHLTAAGKAWMKSNAKYAASQMTREDAKEFFVESSIKDKLKAKVDTAYFIMHYPAKKNLSVRDIMFKQAKTWFEPEFKSNNDVLIGVTDKAIEVMFNKLNPKKPEE